MERPERIIRIQRGVREVEHLGEPRGAVDVGGRDRVGIFAAGEPPEQLGVIAIPLRVAARRQAVDLPRDVDADEIGDGGNDVDRLHVGVVDARFGLPGGLHEQG